MEILAIRLKFFVDAWLMPTGTESHVARLHKKYFKYGFFLVSKLFALFFVLHAVSGLVRNSLTVLD